MKPVDLNIKVKVAEIYNFLYRTKNPEYLVPDILTVALPNGYHIDVSWYPAHDPSGHYYVRVFWEYADEQRITPIETNDIDELLSIVRQLSELYSLEQIPVSNSSVTDHKEEVSV